MRLIFVTAVACAAAFAQTLPPISTDVRVKWATIGTVGPANLAGGVISSGWSTYFNRPREYGPHWDGFGKRYGIRLIDGAISNSLEAGLGAVWGEDPRYYPMRSSESIVRRIKYAVKQAFLARDRNGKTMPAYARYAAYTGSSFLSNAWRVDSDSQASDALFRTGLGFTARMTSNLFTEFWPDIIHRH